MKKGLECDLIARHPALFRQSGQSDRVSCMGRGIETDDGWYGVIKQMCEKLDALGLIDLQFAQIKEKYGLLRVYLDFEDARADDIVNWAERASGVTCEACGEPGRLRKRGWWKTRCNKCEGAFK